MTNATLKPQPNSLKVLVDFAISNEIKNQAKLYEKFVGSAIDKNEPPDKIGEQFSNYQKALNHFDIAAFKQTLNVLRTDTKKNEPERYARLSAGFKALPRYLSERNNFDAKRTELLNDNTSQADKQAVFDTLDRRRTRAHNHVIMFFNQFNELAQDHHIPDPYPNAGEHFDKNNPMEREKVAQILTKHQPVFDTVNNFMADERDKEHVADPNIKLHGMTLTQLYNYAKEHQTKTKTIQSKPAAQTAQNKAKAEPGFDF